MSDENINKDWEVTKNVFKMISETYPETTIIKVLCSFDKDYNLKLVGNVKDIESNYKNDFIDGIYEDEDGNILDVRIYNKHPSQEELLNLSEYWIALADKFNKNVVPCIIITGSPD